MNFKCDNCGKETRFGLGVINLVCQGCGCYDIKFDSPVEVTPMVNDVGGPTVTVKADESFYSLHKYGSIWRVLEMPFEMKKKKKPDVELKKTVEEPSPIVVVSGEPEEKEPEPEKKEPEPEIKPTLLKPKKRQPRWLKSGKE